jgi:hypothetical protein
MRKCCLGGLLLALIAAGVFFAAGNRATQAEQGKKGPMLVHSVYFSVAGKDAKDREKLIRACKEHLSKHPGEVFFTVGPLAEDLKRDVNDRDFDVALTIVFEDRKAHDVYQDAPRHKKFIEENKSLWSKVRVFDSLGQ